LLDALAAAGGVAAGGMEGEASSEPASGRTPRSGVPTGRRTIAATRSGSGEIRNDVSNGGVDDGVDFARSFVMRKGKLLPVDLARLIKQGDLSQNIYLAPDDFIFFRPVDLPSVYVLGAVGGPTILPYSGDLSVASAILSVGGTIKYAQQNKVVIIRGSLTQPQIAEVDYHSIVTGKARDLLLQPGDIVYVPFTPFRRVAQLAEEVLNQFVRTIAVNEGSYIGSGRVQPVGVTAPGFGINVPQ
jgi:protein involved in polysaccharide export with SLBB domain